MSTKDFRASQVETSKIIASGAIAGTTAGLVIYSGSIASNRAGGTTDSAIFNDVGSDVFLFVSGTKSNDNFDRTNVTLFGGDVVVSGTIYAERQVIEVDGLIDGDMIVTGSLRVEPDADGIDAVVFRNAAGTLDLFSVRTSAQAEVTINETSGDVDFRVETNDETHMVFVEGSTNRVSIGDSVDSPSATLEVTNHASAGAFDVPLVQLNSNDIDKVALDINAANTTANIIDVSASALTSGIPLFIDHNDSATTAVTPKTIHVDFDKSGVAGNSVTQDFVGAHIEMNDAATNNAGSTVRMTGLELGVDSANAQGTTHNTGIDINVTDAATNDGIRIRAEDGAGSDIKMMSTANNSDFATIAVGANGAMTITTVDDSTGTSANLNIAVDGATDIQSTGNVTIDSSAGTIGVGTDNVNQNIIIGSHGTRSITVGAVPANGTTTTTINSRGGTLTLEGTGQIVDINSAALDIDASGAITIDGTSTFSIDGVGTSNVTTNGKLIVSGSTHVDLRSDGGPILIAGSEIFGSGGGTPFGSDVKILLSGSVGSRDSGTRGTTSLTGDANISGSFGFSEVNSVPTASPDQAILYAKDDSGITKLFMKQSNGVEVGPLGSGGSLDDAYDTPPGGGTKGPGLGAIITVDGKPVQLQTSGVEKIALAVTGSAIFGSGSDGQLPSLPGTDTNFFVSGSIGSRETGFAGTTAFGGDVVISGSLDIDSVRITSDGKIGIGTTSPAYKLSVGGNAEFGEYLYHRGDTDTFIRFETDKITLSAGNESLLTLAEDTQDIVTIGDGGDVDFRVRSSAGDSLFVKGDDGKIGFGTQNPLHNLSITNPSNTSLMIESGNGGAPASSSIAFRNGVGSSIESMISLEKTGDLHIVNSGSNKDIVFVRNNSGDISESARFTANQVLILSGGNSASLNPSNFNDTNFFVSGSFMSRGTAERGTAVFGGDLVVSGGIYTGRVASSEDPNSFIDLGQNTVELGANHTVVFQRKESDPALGDDTNFFVSGSIDSMNTITKGTSVFGGDVFVSGSFRSKKSLLKHHLIWAGGIASEVPRFAASINGGGGATTTPDIEHFWSVLGSGSLKALDLWVSEGSTARAGISLFINNDAIPTLHCSGSFVNNNIIGDGDRGHLFIDFSQSQYISGTNSFNPGDLISIGLGKLSGGTFSKIRGTLFYEMDETFLHTNQLGGTLG